MKLNLPVPEVTQDDMEFEDRVWGLKLKMRSDRMRAKIEAEIAHELMKFARQPTMR